MGHGDTIRILSRAQSSAPAVFFLRAAAFCVALSLYVLLATALPPLPATLISSAEAKDNTGGDDRDAIEEMRRQQKEEAQRFRQEAREQARRQREEAREQARRDREEAREQARQAREEIQRARQEAQQQAREQAKQFSSEQARQIAPPANLPVDPPDIESSGGFKTEVRPQAVREPLRELRSGGNDRSGGGGTNASSGSQQPAGGTGSGYRAQTSGEGGAAKGAAGGSTKSTAQPAAGQKGGSKSSQGNEQAGKSKNDDDAGGEAEESSKPPATMAEVFKKLFGAPAKDNPSVNNAPPAAKPAAAVPAAPAQPVNGKGKAHDAANGHGAPKEKSAQGVSAKPAAANPKSNASAAPAASGGGGVVPPIDLDIVQRNEVLAINTNKATLQAAVSKGFKLAETSTLSGLNLSVARLITPAGMSKQQAEQQLAGLASNLKAGGFARNERYRIYRTATGVPKASSAQSPAASPGGSACSGTQCYARDLMGWQPSLSACAKSVPVGIIDTAVDLTHPAFKKKSIDVGHLSAGKVDRSPNWHGTGVLGVLAGDGSSQTPGLIPDARFFVADVFFADDDGEPATDTLSLLRGIDWLKRKGARVVNMSLSGPADDLVRDAIGKLAQSGVIFVAAAGNGGPGAPPSYPAAYEPVIAVTAVNKRMTGYRYANQGSYIDLAAPGVDIWTTLPGAQQGYHSGTSFAAPYVTAALATMYRRLDGTSKSQVLQQVSYRDLGDPGRDPVYGNGMLLAPPSCGAESVANSAPAVSAPASAAPATAPIGFGFQSSSVDAVPAFEQLPWLPAGGQ